MSFDDLFGVDVEEPEPEPPVAHQVPSWHGPPAGELAVPVPLGLVLARSERGVVAASHVLVYSAGLQFALVAHVEGLKRGESNRIFHDQHAASSGLDDLPEGLLRFGVELPDGQRASNLDQRWRRGWNDGEPPGAVLSPGGGSGGGSSGTSADWSFGYWLWPLPTKGVLRLYCEWPIAHIPLTTAEVDTGPIVEASTRVTPLWPVETGGPWAHAIASQTSSTMSVTRADPELAPLRATLKKALALLAELEREQA